jgi:hypothetical protein
MAVDANRGPGNIGHSFANGADERAIVFRHGVTRSIGNVDHSSSGINRRLKDFIKIRWLGAAGVLCVEFNIIGVRPSPLDRIHRHPHHLGLLFAQRLSVLFGPELAEDVNIGNADAGVDARLLGFGQRPAASLDIFRYRSREPADDGPSISRAIRSTA